MPDARRSPGAAAAGTLILVVGPSGAGKDTLIDAARAHFAGAANMVFCERHITRCDQTGEHHIALPAEEFMRVAAAGGFFLAWRAHGLHYGIAVEVLRHLREGRTAVANVSRAVIGDARAKWPRTQVIQVTARAEVLRMRLSARGRETAAAIGDRLKRASEIPLPSADWVSNVDNSGDLAVAVARFNTLLAARV